MKKRFGILTMVVVIILAVATTMTITAGADSLQDQINAKQSKVNDLEEKIAKLEKEGKELLSQIGLIEEQTEEIEEQIDLTNDRIKELGKAIDEQSENIAGAEEDIAVRTAQMEERIRAIYMGGSDSYVNMLFESKDFGSFLDTLDTLKILVAADRDMVTEFKTAKSDYESVKASLESDKREMDALKSDLVTQRNKLERNADKLETLKKQNDKQRAAAQKEMDKEYEAIKELIKQQSQGEYVGGEFLWPVSGFNKKSNISAYFGQKGKYWRKAHTGMDIAGRNAAGEGIKGKPILACNSGTVIKVNETSDGYGQYVVISHGGGISTLYGHMISGSPTVSEGDTVVKGQVIGKVGQTGNASGYHLHLEFIVNGDRVDPLNYVSYIK
ncbi:MAG: peptidoglycan DD-metalloendopeptidase family protein [Clostridia bacterium]|nr:peptidoglycan DD-metalloendopeptidase family protein [Clostridia bacterium]